MNGVTGRPADDEGRDRAGRAERSGPRIDEDGSDGGLRRSRVGPEVPVSMTRETFRRAGHALVDRIAEAL
ncbi:MAG TPA: hypothetical protein VE173_10850, partial [Longimicrobiales bacterium]|nr:hypothetical protein [Longimicrobiales bacterium]